MSYYYYYYYYYYYITQNSPPDSERKRNFLSQTDRNLSLFSYSVNYITYCSSITIDICSSNNRLPPLSISWLLHLPIPLRYQAVIFHGVVSNIFLSALLAAPSETSVLSFLTSYFSRS